MAAEDLDFSSLTYERFRQLASDPTLSRHEKVGFPDSYREGKEDTIFRDITQKLSRLNDNSQMILEIGPGCSNLPLMLCGLCKKRRHKLFFVDSPEMLAQIPDHEFVQKFAAYYPDCPKLFPKMLGRFNVILAYSVIQYVFAESNLWAFLDRSLALLSDGGQMLLGDIPNISKRKRFFSSASGIAFHQQFTRADDLPEVLFSHIDPDQIDDSVVLSLISRARAQGFDAYMLPQAEDLPMANRREDILIVKP